MDWDYLFGDAKFYAMSISALIVYVLVVVVVFAMIERALGKFGLLPATVQKPTEHSRG